MNILDKIKAFFGVKPKAPVRAPSVTDNNYDCNSGLDADGKPLRPSRDRELIARQALQTGYGKRGEVDTSAVSAGFLVVGAGWPTGGSL